MWKEGVNLTYLQAIYRHMSTKSGFYTEPTEPRMSWIRVSENEGLATSQQIPPRK